MMRASRRLSGVWLGLVVLTGCGDPDLWARFRAERGMWQAQRRIQRIMIQPRLATARDFERAESACERVLAAFPAGLWASPERLGDPVARDVAREAARAALALGRIAELGGRQDAALERYERTIADWGRLAEIALEAAVARAHVFERHGRTAEAALAWARVAVSFDPVDGSGRTIDDVLAAPRRAAVLEREAGREGEALAALRAGVEKLERVIATETEPERLRAYWEAVASYRSAAGESAGAIDAWRRALESESGAAASSRIRLAIAEEAIGSGAPDSALAILVPVVRARRLEDRLEALLQRGRAFAALGRMDSAMAAWDGVADDHPNAIEPAARARFLRGWALEGAGRWEEARTEYRALGAAYPTHRLAMQAMERIVEYHARRGQRELARLEGVRAVEALDRLILRQRDLDVQFEARRARTWLLDRVGPAEEACEALTAFWRRYPRAHEGQQAGLRAAIVADSALHDRGRAVDLYREMDARDIRSIVRDQVRARLTAFGETD